MPDGQLRGPGAPPRVAFRRLLANVATPTFILPAGIGELQMHHSTDAGQNNAGTLTLYDSSSNAVVSTSVPNGDLPKMGSVYFQVPPGGATYTLQATVDTFGATIYFEEQQ